MCLFNAAALRTLALARCAGACAHMAQLLYYNLILKHGCHMRARRIPPHLPTYGTFLRAATCRPVTNKGRAWPGCPGRGGGQAGQADVGVDGEGQGRLATPALPGMALPPHMPHSGPPPLLRACCPGRFSVSATTAPATQASHLSSNSLPWGGLKTLQRITSRQHRQCGHQDLPARFAVGQQCRARRLCQP